MSDPCPGTPQDYTMRFSYVIIFRAAQAEAYGRSRLR